MARQQERDDHTKALADKDEEIQKLQKMLKEANDTHLTLEQEISEWQS